MKFKISEVEDNIHLLQFKNQSSMCLSFLRFQEFYESPKYRAKVFSLKEFKQWYSKTYGKGKFTYCSDWSGFNFPGWIIKAFEHGVFNPLSSLEKDLMKAISGLSEPFYVIGAMNAHKDTISHEVAHGLWYTQPEYKKNVLDVIKNVNMLPLKKVLLSIGYCEEVMNDEFQAYMVSGLDKGRVSDALTSTYKASILKSEEKIKKIFHDRTKGKFK